MNMSTPTSDSKSPSPTDIHKIATTAWRKAGGETSILRELTLKFENEKHRVPDDRVPAYLAAMLSHPRAKEIGFTLPPEAQALLSTSPDPDPDPDDAFLLADAPATAPQEPEAKSKLHKAALDYAVDDEWPVFPCKPGTKEPACLHGFKDATTDLAQIDTWWTENPDYNIGFEPERAGLCVIDSDRYKPEFDPSAYDALKLPTTLQAKSARGGIHDFLQGSLPSKNSELAPATDCKGRGGYVLLAPSIFEGKAYAWINNLPPAPLPPEIAAKLVSKAEAVSAPANVEINSAINIERGRHRLRDLVKQRRVAVQGNGGNTFTYQIGCELIRDLGLSVDRALELMLAEWNPHCQPPWDQDELRTVISNPASYGQNESGAYAVAPASETFAKVPALPTPQEQGIPAMVAKSRFAPIDLLSLRNRPKPVYWDAAHLFIKTAEGTLAIMSGQKGTHKTGVMLTTVIGLVFATEDARVTYCCAEAPEDVGQFRVAAICKRFGKTVEDLVATGRFQFIGDVPRLLDDDDVLALMRTMLPTRPNIIIVDTTARGLIGQKKNDDAVATAAANAGDVMRREFKALTVMIAHEGKDREKGTKGSSDFEQMADQVIGLEAKGAFVEAKMKHNRKGPTDYAGWFKIEKHTEPGEYTDVPVLMPVAGPLATSASEVFANGKLTEKQAKLRHAVCEELRSLKAYDLSVRVTTNALAMGLVKYLPELTEPRDGQSDKDILEQAIKDAQRMLNNGTRKRGKEKEVLWGLFQSALPPGGHSSQSEQRYWTIPRPVDDLNEED